eukprot:15467876-Alexandrium_andersonii.AAC.1
MRRGSSAGVSGSVLGPVPVALRGSRGVLAGATLGEVRDVVVRSAADAELAAAAVEGRVPWCARADAPTGRSSMSG